MTGNHLHSVHHSLHPPLGPADLAAAIEDMRLAGADLRAEMLLPLPSDPRHMAKLLTRRAVAGAEYVRWARQAAFVADQIADREMNE